MWKFQQNRDDNNNAHVRIIVSHFESVGEIYLGVGYEMQWADVVAGYHVSQESVDGVSLKFAVDF